MPTYNNIPNTLQKGEHLCYAAVLKNPNAPEERAVYVGVTGRWPHRKIEHLQGRGNDGIKILRKFGWTCKFHVVYTGNKVESYEVEQQVYDNYAKMDGSKNPQ